MYQKYYTEALVLKSRERGEADRVYVLYTKDFGLVIARASAVRTEKSRMRYALQSYSRTNVALVKGKRGWRIAGSSAISGGQSTARGVPTFARIAELFLRLVTEEEKNEYLYETLAEAHGAFMKAAYEPHNIEILCVARILYALGYLSSEALATTLFTHSAYAEQHMQEVRALQEKLLTRINRAIAEADM